MHGRTDAPDVTAIHSHRWRRLVLTPAVAVRAVGVVLTWSASSRPGPAPIPAGWSFPKSVPLPEGGTYVTSSRPNGRTRLTAYDRSGEEAWFAERGPGGIDYIEGMTPGDGGDRVIWSISID